MHIHINKNLLYFVSFIIFTILCTCVIYLKNQFTETINNITKPNSNSSGYNIDIELKNGDLAFEEDNYNIIQKAIFPDYDTNLNFYTWGISMKDYSPATIERDYLMQDAACEVCSMEVIDEYEFFYYKNYTVAYIKPTNNLEYVIASSLKNGRGQDFIINHKKKSVRAFKYLGANIFRRAYTDDDLNYLDVQIEDKYYKNITDEPLEFGTIVNIYFSGSATDFALDDVYLVELNYDFKTMDFTPEPEAKVSNYIGRFSSAQNEALYIFNDNKCFLEYNDIVLKGTYEFNSSFVDFKFADDNDVDYEFSLAIMSDGFIDLDTAISYTQDYNDIFSKSNENVNYKSVGNLENSNEVCIKNIYINNFKNTITLFDDNEFEFKGFFTSDLGKTIKKAFITEYVYYDKESNSCIYEDTDYELVFDFTTPNICRISKFYRRTMNSNYLLEGSVESIYSYNSMNKNKFENYLENKCEISLKDMLINEINYYSNIKSRKTKYVNPPTRNFKQYYINDTKNTVYNFEPSLSKVTLDNNIAGTYEYIGFSIVKATFDIPANTYFPECGNDNLVQYIYYDFDDIYVLSYISEDNIKLEKFKSQG